MTRSTIIQPNQSYTFSDYFKLNFAPKDILAYFNVLTWMISYGL